MPNRMRLFELGNSSNQNTNVLEPQGPSMYTSSMIATSKVFQGFQSFLQFFTQQNIVELLSIEKSTQK